MTQINADIMNYSVLNARPGAEGFRRTAFETRTNAKGKKWFVFFASLRLLPFAFSPLPHPSHAQARKAGNFNSLEKIGASEGIRTLDINLGKVALYQTELRSLPFNGSQITGISHKCKPSFCNKKKRFVLCQFSCVS
jgi:hypothetical protein